MTRWHGVIAVEGEVSTDERLIAPGALTWTLPVPLMLPVSQAEEDAPPQVGTIDAIERVVDGTRVFVRASGELIGDLPDDPGLAMFVDSLEVEHTAGPTGIIFTAARLRSVTVGLDTVWPECVLEVEE